MEKERPQFCPDCSSHYTIVGEQVDNPVCCAFCGSTEVSDKDEESPIEDEDES